jgi:hypothetical protein
MVIDLFYIIRRLYRQIGISGTKQIELSQILWGMAVFMATCQTPQMSCLSFSSKIFLIFEMTRVSNGPQPLGHYGCPSQEMYLIKFHQTLSFHEGEAAIAM